MSKAEKNCKWNFAPRVGGIDQGPNEAMGDIFKKLPYSALVREAIQNSLDAAKNEDEPVFVTFKRSSVDTHNYPMLFQLSRHMNACINFWKNDDAKKRFEPMIEYIEAAWNSNKIHYLEISDENTTGMSYRKGSKSSPFYAFVKSIGNSVKTNVAKGGSHGFGKAAYFNASKIRTVLISTLTDSGQYVFEGVSGLCTHEEGGKKREHYGFYTDAKFGDAEDPITNKEDIPVRFIRKEVGTSAFVLGVDYSDRGIERMKKRILESVITNFWGAIIERKLEINFAIDKKYTLNADNIFEFAERCFSEADDNKTSFSNPRPYMDAFANVGSDFNHMYFEDTKPTLGKVELYLTRTKSGNDIFIMMRSPLMMVKSQRNRTNYGFYGVFVCRDVKGNAILRTMEDATHSDWSSKQCDDKSDREKAKKAEDEIKEFLDECIAKVFKNGNTTSLTFGGLEEFLTIPSSLEDEDNFGGETESEIGEGNGERTDFENTETTTDIDDNEDTAPEAEAVGNMGQVLIYEGSSSSSAPDGGEGDDGETPRAGGNGGGAGDGGNQDGGSSGNGGSKGGHVGSDDIPGYAPGDGEPPRRTRLNVRYRAFAQTASGGGYLHRLIIHSNRASDNAIIQVYCSGEVSDEAIPIKSTDQGFCSENVIANVKLQEGRNVINIVFGDDMRHSIILTVYEEE